MTAILHAPAALGCVLLLVSGFCLVMGLRWRNRNDPVWNPLLDPSEALPSGPRPRVRREAARLIREGSAASSPETAHTVSRMSRYTLLRLSNPWEAPGWATLLLSQSIMIVVSLHSLFGHTLAIALAVALCVLLGGMATVWVPLARRRDRSRAERALALNREPAAYTIGKE